MKKRCDVLKARKRKARAFFFYSLARIDRTEETKRALHERYRHTAPVFVHDTTGFAFVAMYQNQIFTILAVLRRSVQRVAGSSPLLSAWANNSSEKISRRWRAVGDTAPI